MKIKVPMKSTAMKPEKESKPMDVKMPRYPQLYLDDKQAPDLCSCEAGDMVTMFVSGKVVSKSSHESEDSEGANITFEIRKIGVLNREGMDMEDEDEGEED